MFCKYCGYKLTDDAIFCPNCGRKIDLDVSEHAAPKSDNKQDSYNFDADNHSFSYYDEEYEDTTHTDTNNDESSEHTYDKGYEDTPYIDTNNESREHTYDEKPDSKLSDKHIVLIIFAGFVLLGIVGILFIGFSDNTPSPQPIPTPDVTSQPNYKYIVGNWVSETPIYDNINKEYCNVYYRFYDDNTGTEEWYNTYSTFYSHKYKFTWISKGPNKYIIYYLDGDSDTFTRNSKYEITDKYGNTYVTTIQTSPTQNKYPIIVETPTPQPTYYPDNNYYHCRYVWDYHGYTFTHTMDIPKDGYNYYRYLGHSNYDLTKYATDKYNRKLVAGIAKSMTEEGDEVGFNEYEKVMMVVTFVQSLPYTSDLATTGYDEYVRYPIETLVNNGGDCEDTSILTAALLREMGYGVVLLKLTDHVAVGVKGGDGIYGSYYTYNNETYFYLETTGKNWDIGEVPKEYQGEKAKVIYVP